MKFLILLGLLWQLQRWPELANAYDFCSESSSCKLQSQNHFTCNLAKELPPVSPNAKLWVSVPDTYFLRDQILNYHNRFRNLVASGNLISDNKIFPPASRMRELIWDLELAYMARLHVNTVSFKHTGCRSVPRFPSVGESLGMICNITKRYTLVEMFQSTLKAMFAEYRYISDPSSFVNKFTFDSAAVAIHFSLLVNERVSRVGCGFAFGKHCTIQKSNYNDSTCLFLTCYYDFINIINSYLYKRGQPASKCDVYGTLPSSRYENLCGNSGSIFKPNHGEDN